MRDPLVIHPPPPRHRLCRLLGAAALVANRARRSIWRYPRPRSFSRRDVYRAAAYDLMVVDGWERALANYVGNMAGLADRCVVEIGPGPDLGAGVVALWRGARRYVALDSRALAGRTKPRFYQALLERLNDSEPSPEKTRAVQEELALLSAGRPRRLEYLTGQSPRILAGRQIDLVVSQAVLEHVVDLESLLADLALAVRDGAIFVAEVDFQTHTRRLRELDPLNIYRYGERFYGACRFEGAPTRRRPDQYVEALQHSGWTDVRMFERAVLADDYVARVLPRLAEPFRRREARMDVLTGVLCARWEWLRPQGT